jgi:hypothetical protein
MYEELGNVFGRSLVQYQVWVVLFFFFFPLSVARRDDDSRRQISIRRILVEDPPISQKINKSAAKRGKAPLKSVPSQRGGSSSIPVGFPDEF